MANFERRVLEALERITYVSPEDAKRFFASCGLDPATTEGNPMPVPLVTKLPRPPS